MNGLVMMSRGEAPALYMSFVEDKHQERAQQIIRWLIEGGSLPADTVITGHPVDGESTISLPRWPYLLVSLPVGTEDAKAKTVLYHIEHQIGISLTRTPDASPHTAAQHTRIIMMRRKR